MSTETIVSTAVLLISEHGLPALSIRSIAAELGLSPMSVYRYVDSKDDLLDLVLLEVLARMEIPPSLSGDWRERIVEVMLAWRDLLLTHANVVPLLLERPIPRGSVGLARVQEAVLSILEHADIRSVDAVRAFWQIFSLTVGQVMFDLPRRQLRDEDMAAYAEALRGIAQERGLRHVGESAAALASMSGRGSFCDSLRVLLAGIATPDAAL